MMVVKNGPVRLIMIRSGKYDYAEVELDVPVHLVGPNNVGKTSLIAALQFLYIDEQRQMNFARSLEETRRYYFPDPNSYILFECRTPSGFKVMGVRGLGPLKGYDFERFSFDGRFYREDFIGPDGQLRDFQAVKARLSAKNYTQLAPRHLRAALTGLGDSKGSHFDIVPLKNRGHFSRFRTVFKNLLRLSHLRQEELKAMILDIFKGEFHSPVIDVETQFSEHYRRVRQEAFELQELKTLEPHIRSLLKRHSKRQRLRQRLPVLWKALEEEFKKRQHAFDETCRKAEEEMACLERARSRARKTIKELKGKLSLVSGEQAVLNERVQTYERDRETFKGFVPSMAEAELKGIQREVERLGAMLAGAEGLAVSRLKQRIKQAEAQLERLRQRLSDRKELLGAYLANMVDGMSMVRLFKVFNPDLLALKLGSGQGADIHEPAKFEAFIRQVEERLDRERLRGPGFSLCLNGLLEPQIDSYLDPQKIEAEFEEVRESLERDRKLLEAAVRKDALRREKEEKTKRLREIIGRIERFRELEKRALLVEGWKEELEGLSRQKELLDQQMEEEENSLEDLVRRMEETKAVLSEARKDFEKLIKEFHGLTPPAFSGKGAEDVEYPRDLLDLMALYKREFRQEAGLSSEIEKDLQFVGRRTYGKLPSTDDPEAFQRLEEEMEALNEKERALEELWSAIVVGLKSSFKGLDRDLETLKAKVGQINRSLRGVSVSNLQRLKLVVAERPELTGRIRQVTRGQELPLFEDPSKTKEAVEALGRLLSKMQRVELGDLFDLHFEVHDSQGVVKKYAHLENIESHGTTITIKVIMNLILLKSLLSRDDIRMPFYLDEVSSLDHNNLQAIVDKSRQLGFTPVLASPEAMAVADNIYFLAEHEGKVVIDPKTSLLRISKVEEDGHSA